MTDDRELLKLAALAAGYHIVSMCDPVESGEKGSEYFHLNGRYWNPRDDDGDALRLAVKLGLDVAMHGCNSTQPYALACDDSCNIVVECQPDSGDPYAATRLAIVLAAAQIGRNMLSFEK